MKTLFKIPLGMQHPLFFKCLLIRVTVYSLNFHKEVDGLWILARFLCSWAIWRQSWDGFCSVLQRFTAWISVWRSHSHYTNSLPFIFKKFLAAFMNQDFLYVSVAFVIWLIQYSILPGFPRVMETRLFFIWFSVGASKTRFWKSAVTSWLLCLLTFFPGYDSV